MNVIMIGTGYVGLVSGVCLAAVGHKVICVDTSEEKIDMLNSGKSPIFERGLDELISKHLKKNLFFTTTLSLAIKTFEDSETSVIIMIAVGTPDGARGADLSQVYTVAHNLGLLIPAKMNAIVVVKSTVPVLTGDEVDRIVNQNRFLPLEVVSNPEFLKEGLAVEDFMKPDRIVIGANDIAAVKPAFMELYTPFVQDDTNKLVFMKRRSSEITKYAANAMLATRISFMNEIARLCDATHADVDDVRRGVGADPRIGRKFLYAGPGWSGSCFPKDVKALIATGKYHGVDLPVVSAALTTNEQQAEYSARKIQVLANRLGGFTDCLITIWGLAFKPATDDVRESRAASIMRLLMSWGMRNFAVTDPKALANFRQYFDINLALYPEAIVTYHDDMYEATKGAKVLVLMTEWSEYRRPDWKLVKENMGEHPSVADLRNQYDRESLLTLGFDYCGIGRR